LILAAVVLSIEATAATVVKCVDAAGKVTFAQHACPDARAQASQVTFKNAAPSGSSAPVRLGTPKPYVPKPVVRRQRVVAEAQPVAAQEPDRGRVTHAAPRQPCIRMVDRHINSTRVTKDGRRVGRSQVIKVPVAC